MRRDRLWPVTFVLASLLALPHARADDIPRVAATKPIPPLSLEPPPAPSPTFDNVDLRKVPPDRLSAVAGRFYSEKQFAKAVQLQYFAAQSTEDGGYNLACYTALAGNRDAAFYWLQKTALEEGLDATWAEQDPDLKTLRDDTRWKQISDYLEACNVYWSNSGHRITTLVLPTAYKPTKPIPVLIGMHGRGANPRGFVSKGLYQHLADTLNLAIVGVSGTIPRGKNSFVWSEIPARDAAHIQRALAELEPKLTPAPGQLIAFGFSQGAQMAFEVAFSNPSDYQGAIVMSPGTTKEATLRELTPAPANKKQAFVTTCGADELLGNVRYTRMDAAFAKKAGSRVELKLYPGAENHAFPADFAEAFPRWIGFIRDRATRVQPSAR